MTPVDGRDRLALRRAGVRVTPPRTQAVGPASTQRARRRQARRILCERRRLAPYCAVRRLGASSNGNASFILTKGLF